MELNFHTFPSGKQYVYIKSNGHPVFLRNILFIHNNANKKQIAIVREWGVDHHRGVYEPPKGQMEWKEFKEAHIRPGTKLTASELVKHMRAGVLRETMEEAKIMPNELKGLRMLPQRYVQDWPESKVPGAKFMYQYWYAEASPLTMLVAQDRIKTLVRNVDWKGILPPDVTEKNHIRWWSPDDGWSPIRGEFSEKMTRDYFKTHR